MEVSIKGGNSKNKVKLKTIEISSACDRLGFLNLFKKLRKEEHLANSVNPV